MKWQYAQTMRRCLARVSLPVLAVVLLSDTKAATTVGDIQATHTQAVIPVNTDQPGNCKFSLFELGSTVPVNDVNPALFPGSNSAARSTTVSLSGQHLIVAGLRTAGQGADGKWYSRALAASTLHTGTVACGADPPVSFEFKTRDIPIGTTYTDGLPYNNKALGNYAVPTFDVTEPDKWYRDYQTGFKFKPVTGPGQMPENGTTITGSLSKNTSPGSVDGEAWGNWINPSGGLVSDGTYAAYKAPGQDPLTLRLASSCPFNDCSGFDWSNVNGSGTGSNSTNIDSYQLTVTGNGAGSPVDADVALSWNGITPGTEWHVITLPASNKSVTYPLTAVPGFAAWQGMTHPLIPGMYWQTVQQRTIVNTNGIIVTYVGGAHFSLDTRILAAGSKLTINGTEHTLASVDSATRVTLLDDAGTLLNATAYLSNFSVMIRKHTPSAGTLNVDAASVALLFSNSFGNNGSGFFQPCSHLTSTDAGGHIGRLCLFNSHKGDMGVFWLTDDLQSRFIGRGYLPTSSIGVAADEYAGGFYSGQSLFDTSDPNSWWMSASLRSNGHPTLVKATYNPQVNTCSMPAGYQPITPAANYDPASSDNCNITYSELTPPSQGKDLYTQISQRSNIATSPKMGNGCGLSFVQNGYAVFVCNNQQDSEAWIATINLSTGLVKGVWSTYMNSAKGSCRGCVMHGVGPSTPTDDWFFLGFNNYPGGPSSGLGPYNLTITTALTATPSLTVAACQALVTDPSVAWLLPYSDGCDRVTYAGSDAIPCDPNPSPWELANAPACSWHSGWTQWQAGAAQIGDWFQDPNSGYELLVIGAQDSGSKLLLRNVNVPQGSTMTPNPGIPVQYLRAHPFGWTAGVWCSFHQNAFVNVSQETNGTGMIWDRRFLAFPHSVLRALGIVTAEWYGNLGFGLSFRAGSYPSAANQPETAHILNGGNFAGATGLGGANYLQSHPGWDGVSLSITDMAPMAPGQGGEFGLWPQKGVTAVGGSLYKIPAVNAYIPLDKRRLATAAWSGMFNIKDVSGRGIITGTAADAYTFCSIDHDKASCGQSYEALGDLYVNIPQATIDGIAGGSYDVNRVNVVPLGPEPLAALQYFIKPPSATNYVGQWERRITTGFGRYNGQDTYSNAKVLWNSKILLFNCATPNLQRIGDICAGLMPPDPPPPGPADASNQANHNNFIPYPMVVEMPAGKTGFAEVQFGYAENGEPAQYYCTSRQEPCNTSHPANVPFNWEAEQRSLLTCNGRCTVNIPVLPGRIVYYRSRVSTDGVSWTSGKMGAAAVN